MMTLYLWRLRFHVVEGRIRSMFLQIGTLDQKPWQIQHEFSSVMWDKHLESRDRFSIFGEYKRDNHAFRRKAQR